MELTKRDIQDLKPLLSWCMSHYIHEGLYKKGIRLAWGLNLVETDDEPDGATFTCIRGGVQLFDISYYATQGVVYVGGVNWRNTQEIEAFWKIMDALEVYRNSFEGNKLLKQTKDELRRSSMFISINKPQADWSKVPYAEIEEHQVGYTEIKIKLNPWWLVIIGLGLLYAAAKIIL